MGQCSKDMGKGMLGKVRERGGGGWVVKRDKGTHRDLHVVSAFIILLVQDLKVVPEGG